LLTAGYTRVLKPWWYRRWEKKKKTTA